MEFGETIPLYFLTLCCMIGTPIVGFSFLAIIHYSLKDKSLAKNILITISISAIFTFLYMGFTIIATLFIIPRCCPVSSGLVNGNLSEIISMSFPYALWMIFRSLTVGFLIAYFIVAPITLIVRYVKKKNAAAGIVY